MTSSTFVPLGLAAAFAGCVCIYLASPNQNWRDRPWPRGPSRAAGWLLLAAGQVALLQFFQPVAAVFAFVVCLMLFFVSLPYAAAFRVREKAKGRASE
ncbi:hypothetical protein [Thauera sinica]|uniref:Uncharacterized protein n=1 Tax=Thauera sinica TaxID=2665146 RepID=A0ABW1AQM6_9RHOO|nr:hypothetical protein [Thauera sp. K11]ATE59664.1 hypothetical protein CCZ27_06620 [Thauera sp. K11]